MTEPDTQPATTPPTFTFDAQPSTGFYRAGTGTPWKYADHGTDVPLSPLLTIGFVLAVVGSCIAGVGWILMLTASRR